MDDRRLDALSRIVAHPPSRRQLPRTLTGAAVGRVLVLRMPHTGAAKLGVACR